MHCYATGGGCHDANRNVVIRIDDTPLRLLASNGLQKT